MNGPKPVWMLATKRLSQSRPRPAALAPADPVLPAPVAASFCPVVSGRPTKPMRPAGVHASLGEGGPGRGGGLLGRIEVAGPYPPAAAAAGGGVSMARGGGGQRPKREGGGPKPPLAAQTGHHDCPRLVYRSWCL